MGTFDEFMRIPLADRFAIRRELVRMTKQMNGGVTGHPRTDKKLL